MLASDVIDHARDTLVDPDGIRWVDTDMLRWLGDGLRATAVLRPSAAAKTTAVLLAADDTKQSIPADGFLLLDITRNMGIDGLTPGKPVREVDYDAMRSFYTVWHSATGVTEIDNYCYDVDIDPLKFWIAPRTHASTPVYVEMEYAETWEDPATVSAVLPLNEEYKMALAEFLCYKALAVDTDVSDPQQSQGHLAAFTAMVGGLKSGNQPE